jgi:hypothetical protein
MTDEAAVLRSELEADEVLADLIETRLWAETDVPASGYVPADGAAICFKLRGGLDDYTDGLQHDSFLFKCYGLTPLLAKGCYRALHAALQNKQAALIKWARREMIGQLLQEPETGWFYVLTAYRVMIQN